MQLTEEQQRQQDIERIQDLYNSITDQEKAKAAEVADCAATIYATMVKKQTPNGKVGSYALKGNSADEIVMVSMQIMKVKQPEQETRQMRRSRERRESKGR